MYCVLWLDNFFDECVRAIRALEIIMEKFANTCKNTLPSRLSFYGEIERERGGGREADRERKRSVQAKRKDEGGKGATTKKGQRNV